MCWVKKGCFAFGCCLGLYSSTRRLAATGALQKFTIRDLTTGKLFVLDDAAPDAAGPAPHSAGGNVEAAAGPPLSPRTASGLSRHVTDVQSGRGMTLEEFDQALGLHSALRVHAAQPRFVTRCCQLYQLQASLGLSLDTEALALTAL